MNQVGSGAGFKERLNGAALIATALIYPLIIFIVVMDPDLTPVEMIGWLSFGVGLHILVTILMSILAAVMTREEPDDERVRAIEHQGARVSGRVLQIGVVMIILGMIARALWQSAALSEQPMNPMLIGYGLMMALVIADLSGFVTRAVGYRRG